MSLHHLRDAWTALRTRRAAGERIDRTSVKTAFIPFVDALPQLLREPIRGMWRAFSPPSEGVEPAPPTPVTTAATRRQPTPKMRPAVTDSASTDAITLSHESLTYEERLARENEIFADQAQVHDLPEIFHYWSHRYLLPILQSFDSQHPEDFIALHLFESARRCGSARPRFVSIGCGNCDAEVRIAQGLQRRGLSDFTLECLDINPAMLERGRQLAAEAGLADHVLPMLGDFNRWAPVGQYDGIMANQSLHHVLELEILFDAIRAALKPEAGFVVSDMIGRNGHQRWPEAAAIVREFWAELPPVYRYNHQLSRQEDNFLDWDCSGEGFEGVRAQDILPLLLERFGFEVFIGFGNVIDPFVDRGFGHHFDEQHPFDRHFIDRVHARDEAEMQAGRITPTHMLAVLRSTPQLHTRHRPNLSPQQCVRQVNRG